MASANIHIDEESVSQVKTQVRKLSGRKEQNEQGSPSERDFTTFNELADRLASEYPDVLNRLQRVTLRGSELARKDTRTKNFRHYIEPNLFFTMSKGSSTVITNQYTGFTTCIRGILDEDIVPLILSIAKNRITNPKDRSMIDTGFANYKFTIFQSGGECYVGVPTTCYLAMDRDTPAKAYCEKGHSNSVGSKPYSVKGKDKQISVTAQYFDEPCLVTSKMMVKAITINPSKKLVYFEISNPVKIASDIAVDSKVLGIDNCVLAVASNTKNGEEVPDEFVENVRPSQEEEDESVKTKSKSKIVKLVPEKENGKEQRAKSSKPKAKKVTSDDEDTKTKVKSYKPKAKKVTSSEGSDSESFTEN